MFTTCKALSQVTHGMGITPSNLIRIPPPKSQPHAWLGCDMEAITTAPWQNPCLCCPTEEENPTPTAGMTLSWVTCDSSIFTDGLHTCTSGQRWEQIVTCLNK